jgi:hypothetical protein
MSWRSVWSSRCRPSSSFLDSASAGIRQTAPSGSADRPGRPAAPRAAAPGEGGDFAIAPRGADRAAVRHRQRAGRSGSW